MKKISALKLGLYGSMFGIACGFIGLVLGLAIEATFMQNMASALVVGLNMTNFTFFREALQTEEKNNGDQNSGTP